MIIIRHRINEIESLEKVSVNYGVEIDIHAFGDKLVVHHDAFTVGVDFEVWLQYYKHKFLILNVKEEGIEERVRQIILNHGINDFFILDMSFPAIIKMTLLGEKRIAVRVSEYESIKTALALKDKVNWVWIDVFNKFPLKYM